MLTHHEKSDEANAYSENKRFMGEFLCRRDCKTDAYISNCNPQISVFELMRNASIDTWTRSEERKAKEVGEGRGGVGGSTDT